MAITNFKLLCPPRIIFGPGCLGQLAELAMQYGRHILLLMGGSSFAASGRLEQMLQESQKQSLHCRPHQVVGEPSPELIDHIVTQQADLPTDVVVAIGGGSVLDAGKAVAAMLGRNESVLDYLEGVGAKKHDGSKVPFIAVPTTSGTGSEATKNAVLSRTGVDGFKKSLRHDNFVPDIALVDPELTLTCPAGVTAACGMDAFTQLLESYVSSKAAPMTDALALSGIEYMKDALLRACAAGGDIEARTALAYASLLSGITLANAGLGVVHGFAGPIGGFFDIPHGVVCGTLLAAATRMTITRLPATHPVLHKYARVGRIVTGSTRHDVLENCQELVQQLADWTERLNLPRLSAYGMTEADLDRIVAQTGNKNNPVELDGADLRAILRERL